MNLRTKPELRKAVQLTLDKSVLTLNAALRGKGLSRLEPVLTRLGRGQRMPHWFSELAKAGSLPNLDGKTIGSVLEMLFVAVLETGPLVGMCAPLRVNPARGIDLPDLDLGVKTPSENYCTSEPFFSAYERLIGSEFDSIILLTDYQTAKDNPPLKLQIISYRYLARTQLADERLCGLARKSRELLLPGNPAWAKRVCRFLAFVNQSDWLARQLLPLVAFMPDKVRISESIRTADADFKNQNLKRGKRGAEPISPEDLECLSRILDATPLNLGVIDALDNWVTETHKDFGRLPNDNEWSRFVAGPLDGKIGMSFALQWRYNFGKLFGCAEPID